MPENPRRNDHSLSTPSPSVNPYPFFLLGLNCIYTTTNNLLLAAYNYFYWDRTLFFVPNKYCSRGCNDSKNILSTYRTVSFKSIIRCIVIIREIKLIKCTNLTRGLMTIAVEDRNSIIGSLHKIMLSIFLEKNRRCQYNFTWFYYGLMNSTAQSHYKQTK